MQPSSGTDTQVAIIGSGFGGLGAAIRLKRAGLDDFVVLERAGAVGGVWRDNHYPGAACDVPSQLYSFSFAPNPAWSHSYSAQPEIWAYLQRCADDFGIRPHIRLNHAVHSASWDAGAGRWRLATAGGHYSATVLILAVGALSAPAIPQLPGSERFAGAAFHSAGWDHSFDLAGKRVAVIGTGASAIQFVPHIQPLVERLHLFQRTPPWVLPRLDRPIGAGTQRLFRSMPLAQRARRAWLYARLELNGIGFRHPRLMAYAERSARAHLAAAVADPLLRARLTPSYTIGCKRILISDDYYPAVVQPNVELIDTGIAEVQAHAIVGGDGATRPIDAMIYGTGFHVTDFPFGKCVRGRTGQTLAEQWGDSPRAHLGTSVAGFPNLFILQGPHTGLGHTSVLLMIEAQIDHILGALRYMARHGLGTIEPRAEAQAAFVAAVDQQMRGTVWVTGGCASWYLDRSGHNSTIWPGTTYQFRRRVARFNPREYHTGAPNAQHGPAGRDHRRRLRV